MKFINVVSGRFALNAVFRHTPPYLILDDEHIQLFKLLAQFFNIKADKTVLNIHVVR